MASAVLGGFLFAVLFGYLILRYPAFHAHLSCDLPQSGPQKFHKSPVPRIGGVPILVGLIASVVAIRSDQSDAFNLLEITLLCSLVAFAGGLVEDLTKQVQVLSRLMLTFLSAALGFFAMDARISSLDLPLFDLAMHITFISLVFTLFAVGGFAHALNIVDGFNGLAGVVALIFLGGIGSVAYVVDDSAVVWSCVAVSAAVLGFLVYNFPKGLVFLGDGGAYMLGFLIAELGVLLVHRNTEVSPWFALVLLMYPVVETIFSIYRKRILRGHSPGIPDGLHLHMLIHKRLVRRFAGEGALDTWANSLTSPFLWLLSLASAIPAVMFWNNTRALQVVALAFILVYVFLYWRIVRFKAPKVLVIRRRRDGG